MIFGWEGRISLPSRRDIDTAAKRPKKVERAVEPMDVLRRGESRVLLVSRI